MEGHTNILEVSTRSFTFKPIWKNFLIEIPFRNFVKKITNTCYKAEWTFFRGRGDEIHKSRVKEKDWRIFRLLLLNLRKAKSKTIQENQRRSFILKYINRAFPTLEIRKKQRPDLYPIADCIKCQQETESFEHLMFCLQDTEAWIKKEKRIIEETWGELDPEEKVNCTVKVFTRAILLETLQAKD